MLLLPNIPSPPSWRQKERVRSVRVETGMVRFVIVELELVRHVDCEEGDGDCCGWVEVWGCVGVDEDRAGGVGVLAGDVDAVEDGMREDEEDG
jgi:hypothetical protein